MTYKPLARLTRKKERFQATNIKNKRGVITTGTIDMQRAIKEYYELHAHKFET
jgi:hypothetical protein